MYEWLEVPIIIMDFVWKLIFFPTYFASEKWPVAIVIIALLVLLLI